MLMRKLRASGRLLVLLWHVLLGVWIVYMRFPQMDAALRRATVERWQARLVALCGIRLELHGALALPPDGGGVLQISNHISWLDISTLHGIRFCRFVSKSEVKDWPLVGRLADAADTLYLQRASRRDAHRMLEQVAGRLQAGDVITVFPEGTTSDGVDLLPFHANMFQAAIQADAPIQPIAIRFLDAQGQVSLAPCYINNDSLWDTLWRTLQESGLVVSVRFGELQYAQGRSRQQWAEDVRTTVAQLRR